MWAEVSVVMVAIAFQHLNIKIVLVESFKLSTVMQGEADLMPKFYLLSGIRL